MDTLHPRTSVWLGGKSLEHWGLRRFLSSVSVTRVLDRTAPTKEKPKGKAKRSSASIVLQNPDNQIIDFIALKEDLEIWLGYGSDMYYRGSYLIVQPSISWPNSAASSITLTAEDYSAEMLANDALVRTFGDPGDPAGSVKLGDAVEAIAQHYNMKAEVDDSIANLRLFNTCKMRGETDWEFLERILKTTNTGFLFVDSSPIASGKPHTLKVMPFEEARPFMVDGGILKLGYMDSRGDIPLASAKLTMDRLPADALSGANIGDTGTLHIAGVMGETSAAIPIVSSESVGVAGNQASAVTGGGEATIDLPNTPLSLSEFRKTVALWQQFKIKISATLKPAVPFLYPGYVVQLLGLGPFSGRVLITSVKDSWGSGGYTQTLEMRSAEWLGDQAGKGSKDGSVRIAGTQGELSGPIPIHQAD